MVVTRCPNCHARFRVSDGQLKLAAGQVRCGACLLVFDALQHSFTQAQRSSAKPTPEQTVVNRPAQQNSAQPLPPSVHSESSSAEPDEVPNTTSLESVTPGGASPLHYTTAMDRPQDSHPLATQTETQPDTTASAQEPTPASSREQASAQPTSDTQATQSNSDAAGVLSGFRAEALQLSHPAEDDPNPVSTTGWLLLCFLAVLGLGAQLIWFERAQLARYPQLGSLYALLCDQVDCSLQRPALDLIHNHSLLLQPHPQYLDALTASILLENQAPFEQPWPALNLRFTDLKGRLVAQRTFQPNEYLDASVMDPKHMPPGRSLQVNLELATPGRRGTSYELELVAPL